MFGVARKVAGRMLHRWSEERMRVCLEWIGLTWEDAIADSGWAHLFREGGDTVDCGSCKLLISLESVCCEGGSMSETEV